MRPDGKGQLLLLHFPTSLTVLKYVMYVNIENKSCKLALCVKGCTPQLAMHQYAERTSESMYKFLVEIIVWHKFKTPKKGWGGLVNFMSFYAAAMVD